MKNLLIAAGAGALLVVAQTAVSAAHNPLDRVGATAKDLVAARVLATETTAGPDYTAFADRPVRFDAGLDEVNTAKPEGEPIAGRSPAKPGPDTGAREPVVADRLSSEPTSYNSLISQSTTPSPKGTYSRYWGCYFGGPGCRSYGNFGAPPGAVVGLGFAAIAIAVVADDSESD